MEKHIKHIQLILEQFEKIVIVINLVKCELGKSEIIFLDHHINSAEIYPVVVKLLARVSEDKGEKLGVSKRSARLQSCKRERSGVSMTGQGSVKTVKRCLAKLYKII